MRSVIVLDGGMGADALAYIRAGQRFAAGEELYQPLQGIGDMAAYRYPPSFALLWAPFAGLPELVVAWLYRIICFGCLYYLMGSWRAVGIALLFPPLAIEMVTLNITMPIAALARWSLRSSNGSSALSAATYVKQSTVTLLPYLWYRRPNARRSLALGAALAIGVVALHALLDPVTHVAYFDSLRQQANSGNLAGQLLRLLPSLTADFALRLGLAIALTIIAIRRGWDWLAFAAAMLAVPTLWLARLAPLVAVPRLWIEDQRAMAEKSSDQS